MMKKFVAVVKKIKSVAKVLLNRHNYHTKQLKQQNSLLKCAFFIMKQYIITCVNWTSRRTLRGIGSSDVL